MLGEELRRLITWGERHRRLLARVIIALCLSVVVDIVCSTLMWSYEKDGSASFGQDAAWLDAVTLQAMQ